MRLFVFLLLLSLPFAVYSQSYQLSGRLVDASDKAPLAGVSVYIVSLRDTTIKDGVMTDEDGYFTVRNLYAGRYSVRAHYLGYRVLEKSITVDAAHQSAGVMEVLRDTRLLDGVVVKEVQTRAELKGDTLQFNADAYKVHPDATAEDLVKKMPGITSDNNGIKANGEDVKKVLVDGRPFFGSDPGATLKNLPAEIVDKVQVFDNQSDQARFTGFKDGNAEKAINIVTKSGKNTGRFGKVYGGFGSGALYQAGGNINFFDGARRISLIGLSNNINQQNFSIADIMNVMSNSSGSGHGMPSEPQQANGGTSNLKKSSNGNFGFGPGGLLVAQQGGLTTTHSAGINYSDEWGKRVSVSGSYFYNKTDNDNQSAIARNYFLDTGIHYSEQSDKHTDNSNHRLNLRIEYAPDSANKLVITPVFTFQENRYKNLLQAYNSNSDGRVDGVTNTSDSAVNKGWNFSNSLLYQHQFRKRGRTLSANVVSQLNSRRGDGIYYSEVGYSGGSTSLLNQQYDISNTDNKLSGTLAYTEPLGSHSQLMLNYSPSYARGESVKNTFSRDTTSSIYNDFDTALSNNYSSIYQVQRGGFSLRYQKGSLNINAGADAQFASLAGDQQFPVSFQTQRAFRSVLPAALLEYRPGRTKHLFVSYRTSNTAPSLSQLQNVLDVSNPLQLSIGNPDLDQTYEHSLMVRLGKTNLTTSRNFFFFLSGNYVNHYIGSATYIPQQDTVFRGYSIAKGSQLTTSVNLDGYVSGKIFGVYSMPVKSIRSNVNLNGALSCSRLPSEVNNYINYATTWTFSGGCYAGSNISEALDFSVSYNGNYNLVSNTLQSQSNSNYYSHSAAVRLNWIMASRLVFSSDMTHTLYSGLSDSYNQDFFLWNASIGYKFLKNRGLEAKLYVYDILGQNRSVSRVVSETYTQDSKTNVLGRYGMLILTYTIRNFKNGSVQPSGHFQPPPGMMPPPQRPGE